MSSRESILASIRDNNRISANVPDWDDLPRAYRRVDVADRSAVLERFVDRLHDYDATVVRCSPTMLGEAVGNRLADLDARVVLLAEAFDTSAVMVDVMWKRDAGLDHRELEQCDAVLTTSTLGIAETGTIVLQNDGQQGRRALTLVPDVHVCIVRASTVVASVPEAFAQLEATATLPMTFISGPSATADIEMTRVKGVHGPRFLHVVLVDDAAKEIEESEQR